MSEPRWWLSIVVYSGLALIGGCSFPDVTLRLPEDAMGSVAPDTGPPPGVVSLSASPSVFILHRDDTRETTLTLSNQTGAAIDVPPQFTVTGLIAGTMSFSANTCGAHLDAAASCSATGNLVATAVTTKADFQVSLGTESVMLSVAVMATCYAGCGPSFHTNCCASSVVSGNAVHSALAGELFYRSYDVAVDQMFPNKTAPAEVSDFRLDTYEVTVGRFRAFVNAGMGTSATAPSIDAGARAGIAASGWDPTWNGMLRRSTADLIAAVKCNRQQTWTDDTSVNDVSPINCVTWFEAMAFCIWDGGFLPTEAEWNYAASGGSEQRPYPWSADGATSVDCTYANYTPGAACVNQGDANRVGSESPKGDGRWGQADLAGNLGEWILDLYSGQYPSECQNCANLAGERRVTRGGGVLNGDHYLRTGARESFEPITRDGTIGVRCGRTP